MEGEAVGTGHWALGTGHCSAAADGPRVKRLTLRGALLGSHVPVTSTCAASTAGLQCRGPAQPYSGQLSYSAAMSLTSNAPPSSPPAAIRLVSIDSAADPGMAGVKQLIRDFHSFLGGLGVDISYQGLEDELQKCQTATAMRCLHC